MSNVTLRGLFEDDLEIVRGWRNSPEVSQYMYTNGNISEEQQKVWYQKIKDDPTKIFWIIEYNHKPLGVASLTDINKTFSSCYWAFYLGEATVRGGGVGAKVEFNVLSYVFDKLKLNKLRCEVFNFNDKVVKMHEKFGFRREAYYRQHCLKNGDFEDVVGLAMLQSEWIQMKPSLEKKIYGEKL